MRTDPLRDLLTNASDDFLALNEAVECPSAQPDGQGHMPEDSDGKARPARRRGAQPEAQLQGQIIDLLRTLGYGFIYHTHSSRFSEGGFPDLLAVRLEDRKFVVIEVKNRKGKLRPEKFTKKGRWIPGQADWLQAFNRIGAECFVVRVGQDLEELAEVLQ